MRKFSGAEREDKNQRDFKGKGYIRENREVVPYTHLCILSVRTESMSPTGNNKLEPQKIMKGLHYNDFRKNFIR
jgi:hypothetical protein